MNTRDKAAFVRDLISSVRTDLLKKVSRTPEEWDGHELRQWIADSFREQAYSNVLKGKRHRDYVNAVAVHNL
jgi:hypothetical protein